MPALARLERVSIRKVWSHEAHDFTPWLAQDKNLAILGNAIGVELELEAQEKTVGPFRAESGKAAHKTDFGPESAIDLETAYADGLRWSARTEFTDDAVHALSKAENAATYLSREITAHSASAAAGPAVGSSSH